MSCIQADEITPKNGSYVSINHVRTPIYSWEIAPRSYVDTAIVNNLIYQTPLVSTSIGTNPTYVGINNASGTSPGVVSGAAQTLGGAITLTAPLTLSTSLNAASATFSGDVTITGTSAALNPVFSGALETAAAMSITLKRFNNIVYYHCAGLGAALQATTADYLSCPTSTLAAGFSPAATQIIYGGCLDDTTPGVCLHQINSNGSIQLSDNSAKFSGAGNLTISPVSGFWFM